MKHAPQSAPCCLICSQPFEIVEAVDYPEDLDRALICTGHAAHLDEDTLKEVYLLGLDDDAYCRRAAEVSAHIRGQTVQAAWYTPAWFSLLLELSSEDLLLIYPTNRQSAFAYIPRRFRAPDSPKGLVRLLAEGLTEVSGSTDQGKPKPGLRGVVAAMQLGLPIENIRVECFGHHEGIVEIAFGGYYKVEVRGRGFGGGCYEWVREHDADDLALKWLHGREPQLIAMC